MKFRYLGTAAAEGFPAMFCECEYCNEARKRKGKNIRTRSQSIIDKDLLIDFPADTYMHAINGEIEMFKVKYLLLTHEHSDHFYPQELNIRGRWFAPTLKQKITIVGSSVVYEKYLKFTDQMNQGVRDLIDFKVVNAFEKFALGDYEIVALPARHLAPFSPTSSALAPFLKVAAAHPLRRCNTAGSGAETPVSAKASPNSPS